MKTIKQLKTKKMKKKKIKLIKEPNALGWAKVIYTDGTSTHYFISKSDYMKVKKRTQIKYN